jgi:hypothetical protein
VPCCYHNSDHSLAANSRWRSQFQSLSDPDTEESRLRHFCQLYWGKGDVGRSEIYKTDTLLVPHLDDDDATDYQQPKSSVDHPQDEIGGTNRSPETSGASARNDANTTLGSARTSYTYISLGRELSGFFDGRSEIVVRNEYLEVMKHLEGVQAERMGGAVVTGRPGIGQESPRLYLHFLTHPSRKNVIYLLCTHRENSQRTPYRVPARNPQSFPISRSRNGPHLQQE